MSNPAWQPILDALPSEFHKLIEPKLKEWDQGVQQKFQEIHNTYEPYKKFKPFIDHNVDFEYAEQAVSMADYLQRDPQALVNNINEAYKLGYVSKEEAEQLKSSSTEEGTEGLSQVFGDDNTDIANHPMFKKMQETLDQLQADRDRQAQQQSEEEAIAEFEQGLDELEKQYEGKPFDRNYVTALASQGVDPEEAVKSYHKMLVAAGVTVEGYEQQIEQQQTNNSTETPPVVMGGAGTVGSGSGDGDVNVSTLSKNDLNATVEQLLQQADQS